MLCLLTMPAITQEPLSFEAAPGKVLLPRLTTTQRDSLPVQEGMIIYNLDNRKFQGYGQGQDTLDQMQTMRNSSAGGDRWQSFTAGYSGTLVQLDLFFGSNGTSDLFIYESQGIAGDLLYTENITFGMGENSFSMNESIQLVSGNVYTIRLESANAWGIQIGTDPYPQGISSVGSQDDFYFKTYMRPVGWVNLQE